MKRGEAMKQADRRRLTKAQCAAMRRSHPRGDKGRAEVAFTETHLPRRPTMTQAESWWVGLTREQFAAERDRRAEEMRLSKFGGASSMMLGDETFGRWTGPKDRAFAPKPARVQ